eukprot:13421109-Alexandrium_andersonii.AAC.1
MRKAPKYGGCFVCDGPRFAEACPGEPDGRLQKKLRAKRLRKQQQRQRQQQVGWGVGHQGYRVGRWPKSAWEGPAEEGAAEWTGPRIEEA